jgi:hypothetical protein
VFYCKSNRRLGDTTETKSDRKLNLSLTLDSNDTQTEDERKNHSKKGSRAAAAADPERSWRNTGQRRRGCGTLARLKSTSVNGGADAEGSRGKTARRREHAIQRKPNPTAARLWKKTGAQTLAPLKTEPAKRKIGPDGAVAGRRHGRRNSKGKSNPSAA